jgi:hypothetical protein
MKSIFLVIILSFSFTCFAKKSKAAKPSSSGANIINPTYMPKTGDFIIDGAFIYDMASYEQNNTTLGANLKDDEVDTTIMDLDFSAKFGVTDKIEVGGSTGFIINKTVQSLKNERSYSGLKDIEAYGRYRIFKQNEKKFNIDVKGTISPGFLNREEANSQDDGNVFRGGTVIDIRGIISQKLDKISWSAFVALIYNGTQTVYNATTGDESDQFSSRMDISIGGLAQFKLSPKIYIDAGMDLNRLDVIQRTIPGSAYESQQDAVMQFKLTAKGYFIFRDNLIFNGSFNFINNLDSSFSSGSTNSFERIVNRGFQFGGGATYKF